MASVQKAQTGKRVYKGASHSPNKGRVSAKGAMGYVKREQRKQHKMNRHRLMGKKVANPKGADGKSDMRSAVAAKALMRLRRMNNAQG